MNTIEGRVGWMLARMPISRPKYGIGTHVLTQADTCGVVMERRDNDLVEVSGRVIRHGLPYARDAHGFYMLAIKNSGSQYLVQFWHESEIVCSLYKPRIQRGHAEGAVVRDGVNRWGLVE